MFLWMQEKRRAASCRKSWESCTYWIGIFDRRACGTFHFPRKQNQSPANNLIPLFGATKKNRSFRKAAFRKKEIQGRSSFGRNKLLFLHPSSYFKKWLLLPRTCITAEYLYRAGRLADTPLSVPTAEVSRIVGENLALGCRDREEIGDDQHFQRRTSVESPSLLDYHPVSMSSAILRKEIEIGD